MGVGLKNNKNQPLLHPMDGAQVSGQVAKNLKMTSPNFVEKLDVLWKPFPDVDTFTITDFSLWRSLLSCTIFNCNKQEYYQNYLT